MEKSNLQHVDFQAEMEYAQNKLSMREIKLLTKEGLLASRLKEIDYREQEVARETNDLVHKKNDLSISLAQYDDAVYLLEERKAKLDDMEQRIKESKKQLIEDHNATLKQLVDKEHELLRKEHLLREKYRKIAKELNHETSEAMLSQLNIDLEL